MESLRNPTLSVELIRGCYLKKGANLPRLWHRSGKAAEHVAEAPVATCPPSHFWAPFYVHGRSEATLPFRTRNAAGWHVNLAVL